MKTAREILTETIEAVNFGFDSEEVEVILIAMEAYADQFKEDIEISLEIN